MNLRVVGAGLPRTGTNSLKLALEHLLGRRCYHMREIPGHPFDLGPGWALALAGGTPDWTELLNGYVATVDWPASMFWRVLNQANPDELVLLSVRDSAEMWWQSANETILPVARRALAPDWREGRGLLDLLERFIGSSHWDDPATLMTAYEQHNEEVKRQFLRDGFWSGTHQKAGRQSFRRSTCQSPIIASPGPIAEVSGVDYGQVN
jgi:hypothetical protein